MPAGCIYPEALGQSGVEKAGGADELALDWPGGYAASVASALLKGGLEPWAFDLSRLARGAVARSSDPWLVPCLEAARRLASLEFRIDAYAEPTRTAIRLPDQPPGQPASWASESPFEPAPEFSEAAGSVAMLSEGLWRFLSPDGELLVSVDAEDRPSYVLR